MLLEQGADLNTNGGCDGSALQAAVCAADEEVVRLLEKGADVNAAGGFYGCALQAAIATPLMSSSVRTSITELLLENGADINY